MSTRWLGLAALAPLLWASCQPSSETPQSALAAQAAQAPGQAAAAPQTAAVPQAAPPPQTPPVAAAPPAAQPVLAVIPAPAQVQAQQGSFTVTPRTVVSVPRDAALEWTARYFADLVKRTHALELQVAPADGPAPAGSISFALGAGESVTHDEGYELRVSPQGVTVAAKTANGLLYGAVTLWQLLSAGPAPAPEGGIELAALRIDDAPRFAWRGMMLDSARHYQSPQFIERFIDTMAQHKFNTLHWHLTDDQAWRIEIKKYPRLAEVGGWRVPAGAAPAANIDPQTGKPRMIGGIYTQEVARHLVEYAAQRGITIVPEIEMPGHATAPLVAYPQYASTDEPPTAVPSDWGVYTNLFNVEESTFAFLQDVLDEVMAVFPGPYIHVGGDEAVKNQWRASARIQERMKELGVEDEQKLQSYFIRRIEAYLSSKGRRLIGWDEILEGGIAPNATVMSWRGTEGAVAAARSGHDAVLTPGPTFYLDNYQSLLQSYPPGRGRVIGADAIYAFDPLPEELEPAQHKHILGVQGNIWTEHIRTEERVEFMAWPRGAAIAEVAWSPAQRRDWNGFVQRLPAQFQRYSALGVRSADLLFRAEVKGALDASGQKVSVELAKPLAPGQIHYTTDGSEPSASSPRYEAPFEVPLGSVMSAAAFLDGQRLSATQRQALEPAFFRRRNSHQLKQCNPGRLLLSLEDDAPIQGERAVFFTNIFHPCWIYEGADLSSGATLTAAVGQLPYNFQVLDEINTFELRPPETPHGELEVFDGCEGERKGPRIAVLSLEPALNENGVTVLPAASLPALPGKHDLCFRFTQRQPDPLWAVQWVEVGGPISSE